MVVPTYTWSDRSFDTPGASVTSCTKFLLLIESSRTWSPLITVDAVGYSFNRDAVGFHRNDLRYAARFKDDIYVTPLADIDLDVCRDGFFEVGCSTDTV